jgi:hypothetical protein
MIHPPERNGPVAGGAASRAEYQVAEQHVDTPNRAPTQSVDPLVGIKLRGFRRLPKGALIGNAHIELSSGLLVHDCPVFRTKDGSAWAALAAKQLGDRNGMHKADLNSKRQFAPMLECHSRELGNRFSATGIALIEQACPDALDDGREQ